MKKETCLLDTEEQQENGEFYTPRIIVRYMLQKTLANNIATNCKIDFEQIYNFILYSNEIIDENISTFAYEIDEYLDNIKVLEPSVGSGAFLLSMLNEIVKVRKALDIYLKVDRSEYELKYHTSKNCLYGVDIESDAIEISKLRLWLSLVVDETIRFDEPPKPLPNLAFNLCVGDSLVDTIHGVTFDENFKIDKRYKAVHWTSDFGYFPTYALGSAMSAQFLNAMEKDFNPFEDLKEGNFKRINEWLKEHVHKYGRSVKNLEVVKLATNEDFNPKYYVEYLKNKFAKIYNL